MTLNTEIAGDPTACRVSGEWARGLAATALESSTQLQQVIANSEYCWGDANGDAFRHRIDAGKRDAAILYEDIGRMGDAMVGFADDLQRALDSMHEARVLAVEAGLFLTPATIEYPNRPPDLPYDRSGHLDEISEDARARDRYNAQRDAYGEAERIVNRARGEEQDAHDTAARKMEAERADILQQYSSSLFSNPLNWTQLGVGHAASTFSQASTWSRAATAYDDLSNTAYQAIRNAPDQASARIALAAMLQNQQQATAARFAAYRLSEPIIFGELRTTKFGRGVLNALTANPGSTLPTTGYIPRVASGLVGNVSPSGAIFAAVGVGMDLREGESMEQALVSQGAALVAGGATTSLLMASASGGPWVFGAVLIGIGVSVGADMAIDSLYDDEEGAG